GRPPRPRGCDHDPARPNLTFDTRVLIEAPVDEILVVGHGRVERDDQPTHPTYFRTGPVVDVLPEHSVVLFVHADRVAHLVRLAMSVGQNSIEVSDLAQAVAAQRQRLRHVAQPPLADVKRGAWRVVWARVT